MTVENQIPYRSFTANGSQTNFVLGFYVDDKNHFEVKKNDHVISKNDYSYNSSSNSIVFNTTPIQGDVIEVKRDTATERATTYATYNNTFRPEVLNKDIDRIWLKIQELGVADELLKIYTDRLHTKQKDYIDNQDQAIKQIIADLRNYVNQQGSNLTSSINSLKSYVDQKDNENNSYFTNLINKQGVSLEQLNNYYQHLLKGMADIASEKGWLSSLVVDASGKSQQEVNDLLNYASYKTPRQFGGIPNDPLYDNKDALRLIVESGEVIYLDGFYYTSEAFVVESNTIIKGAGSKSSGIVKVRNKLADIGIIPVSVTASDNYNVDAILIIKAPPYTSGTAYAKNIEMESFALKRLNSTVSTNYGLFAPRLAQSRFVDIPVSNTTDDGTRIGYGVRVINGWMLSWDRVESTANYPFYFGSDTDGHGYSAGGGTSNTFVSCWAAGGGSGAWRFYGMTYSNLISCGGDYIGTDDISGSIVYDFRACYMGLINCSSEQIRGRLLRVLDSSSITVINPHFEHGVYGDSTLDALIHVSGNSKCTLLNGLIKRHEDATNPVYRVQYNSILRVVDVAENFTFDVSELEKAPHKNVATVFNGTSQFIHENGAVKISRCFNKSLFSANETDIDLKSSGSIELTASNSKLKLTNFSACEFNNPLQLGRLRLWRANVNDAIGIYYKVDGNPENSTNGALLNSLRSVEESPPSTKLTGQHYLNVTEGDNKPYWWNGTTWRDALGNLRSTKPSITGKRIPTTIAEQNIVIDSIIASLVANNLVTDNRTTS